MFDIFYGFKQKCFEILKYFAACCFIAATLVMFSPHIAGYSILPWVLFLTGNFIWGYDSYKSKNRPWFILSIVFCMLDVFLVWARLKGLDIQL